MTERSTTVESVAPTVIFTGGALALVATALPWARVTDPVGTFYLVHLDDVNRAAAPTAALWLVFAVAAALASRGSEPWTTIARFGTGIFATVGAFLVLSETVLLSRGTAMLAHAGVTDNPALVTAVRVIPDLGCLLYAVGLTMITAGVGLVELARRDPRPEPAPPGGRPALHRVVVVLALLVGVGSAILPWYSSPTGLLLPTTGAASSPGHGDAQAWLGIYRVGLAACLAITVLALVLRRHAPKLRLLGLTVGVAVTIMLLSGYGTLWRQPTLQYAMDRIGTGYHLGVLAMLLLTFSFAALPSGTEVESAESEQDAAEAEEPA